MIWKDNLTGGKQLGKEMLGEPINTVLSSVVEAGSLKGRLTDLRYRWIRLFLTGD